MFIANLIGSYFLQFTKKRSFTMQNLLNKEVLKQCRMECAFPQTGMRRRQHWSTELAPRKERGIIRRLQEDKDTGRIATFCYWGVCFRILWRAYSLIHLLLAKAGASSVTVSGYWKHTLQCPYRRRLAPQCYHSQLGHTRRALHWL